MFFDFGLGEIAGLFVLAMILMGPDRIPQFAVQAARMVKKVRTLATKATAEIKDNLGPGFEDLQVKDLNPKTFVKNQINSLIDEEDGVKKSQPKRPEHTIDPDLL